MTTVKDEALASASRKYSDDALDVVTYNIPNSELDELNQLNFLETGADWQDFVRFHKIFEPENLLHGDEPYDVVTGPLFRRFSGADSTPIAWPDRSPQTSIHTPTAVDVFNRYAVKP